MIPFRCFWGFHKPGLAIGFMAICDRCLGPVFVKRPLVNPADGRDADAVLRPKSVNTARLLTPIERERAERDALNRMAALPAPDLDTIERRERDQRATNALKRQPTAADRSQRLGASWAVPGRGARECARREARR